LRKRKREEGHERREKEERIVFLKPRERKKMENEIFLGPFHLNTPFVCNYHYTLALNVFSDTDT
jgi:hypothetical protein